jgi:hypothetical protein
MSACVSVLFYIITYILEASVDFVVSQMDGNTHEVMSLDSLSSIIATAVI